MIGHLRRAMFWLTVFLCSMMIHLSQVRAGAKRAIAIQDNDITSVNKPSEPDPYELLVNKTNHKWKTLANMPSYDLINSNLSSSKIGSRITVRPALNLTSLDADQLNEFKRTIKAKRRRAKRKRHNSMNATLQEDIETINILIGMLMMANRKLIEQRDKPTNKSTNGSSSGSIDDLKKLKTKLEQKSAPVSLQLSKLDPKTDRQGRASEERGRGKSNETSSSWTMESTNGVEPRKDHDLVKPGFDKEKKPKAEESSRLGSREQDSTLTAEAHYSNPMLGILRPDTRDDILEGHKPLVAHDLLHVQRQQTTPSYPRDLGENMFVSRPEPIMAHPMYGHSGQQVPLLEDVYMRPKPPAENEESNGINVDELHPHARLPMVPPYNTHNPHSRPVVEPNQGYTPQVHPALRQPYGHAGPELSLGGHSLGENEIGDQPLNHILMAAKNQQAAAQAYERRRLDHELELRRRQQMMKKQHEEHLKRQKETYERQRQMNDQAKEEHQGDQQEGNNQQSEPEGGDHSGQNEEGPSSTGNENNSEQEGDQGNAKDKEDPDMKSFQNFAGDTDFTDLFPPGILSDDEIKEMRKQQAEQKQQEQEEQEERERPQEGDQEEQSGGSGEQQQGEQTEQNNQAQNEEQSQLENVTNKTANSMTRSHRYNSSSVDYSQTGGSSGDVTTPKQQAPKLFVPSFHSLQSSAQNSNSLSGPTSSNQNASQALPTPKRRRSHSSAERRHGYDDDEEPRVHMFTLGRSEYTNRYTDPYPVASQRNSGVIGGGGGGGGGRSSSEASMNSDDNLQSSIVSELSKLSEGLEHDIS